MECPHLSSALNSEFVPPVSLSSWSCEVCGSDQSSWICLTCLRIHCGRYVNGHAIKHFEDKSNYDQEQSEENRQHCVCMDCTNYSIFCYICDEFVVNDTALAQVQKIREHLESSGNVLDNEKKRKREESAGPETKILKTNDGATLAATGLRNLGNTCFMNAILQSLSNIEQFSCYFHDMPAAVQLSGKTAGRMYHTRSHGDTSVSLVEEVRKTLCSLWKGNQTAFSPDSLFYTIWKLMPSFRGYQQQDAHEFMRYLLDHLHRELQGTKNGENVLCEDKLQLSMGDKNLNETASIVTNIFGGILQNEVNCLICGTESRKFDPFLDLSLDIPCQFRQKKNKDQDPGPICTLYDCLQSFIDLEELDETELYYCLKCKKRQRSTKKFWIKKLPKVFCLHLKRFHWTTFMRNKVDTYVNFPMKSLDMRSFLLEPEAAAYDSCLYDLAAIAVHHGSGVGSGHYTAYGCHEGRWYHFNDSTVTLTNEETVAKAKAYILFYVESMKSEGLKHTTEIGVSTKKEGAISPVSEVTAPPQNDKIHGETFNTSAVNQTQNENKANHSMHCV